MLRRRAGGVRALTSLPPHLSIETLAVIFRRCDADGSGGMDVNEFRVALRALGCVPPGVGDEGAFAVDLFSQLDVDRTGALTLAEWVRAYTLLRRVQLEPALFAGSTRLRAHVASPTRIVAVRYGCVRSGRGRAQWVFERFECGSSNDEIASLAACIARDVPAAIVDTLGGGDDSCSTPGSVSPRRPSVGAKESAHGVKGGSPATGAMWWVDCSLESSDAAYVFASLHRFFALPVAALEHTLHVDAAPAPSLGLINTEPTMDDLARSLPSPKAASSLGGTACFHAMSHAFWLANTPFSYGPPRVFATWLRQARKRLIGMCCAATRASPASRELWLPTSSWACCGARMGAVLVESRSVKATSSSRLKFHDVAVALLQGWAVGADIAGAHMPLSKALSSPSLSPELSPPELPPQVPQLPPLAPAAASTRSPPHHSRESSSIGESSSVLAWLSRQKSGSGGGESTDAAQQLHIRFPDAEQDSAPRLLQGGLRASDRAFAARPSYSDDPDANGLYTLTPGIAAAPPVLVREDVSVFALAQRVVVSVRRSGVAGRVSDETRSRLTKEVLRGEGRDAADGEDALSAVGYVVEGLRARIARIVAAHGADADEAFSALVDHSLHLALVLYSSTAVQLSSMCVLRVEEWADVLEADIAVHARGLQSSHLQALADVALNARAVLAPVEVALKNGTKNLQNAVAHFGITDADHVKALGVIFNDAQRDAHALLARVDAVKARAETLAAAYRTRLDEDRNKMVTMLTLVMAGTWPLTFLVGFWVSGGESYAASTAVALITTPRNHLQGMNFPTDSIFLTDESHALSGVRIFWLSFGLSIVAVLALFWWVRFV